MTEPLDLRADISTELKENAFHDPQIVADEAAPVGNLPGHLQECSLRLGWSSLLLRRYREPAIAEDFETAPTANQLIVLVKDGSTKIECFNGGRWRAANYRPGDLGLTAPGETARLRWSGPEQHTTVQLYLPEAILEAAVDDVCDRAGRKAAGLNLLSTQDPLIRAAILALDQAIPMELPDLYAASAAHFLAVHLVSRRPEKTRHDLGDQARLRRLDEYMRVHLADPVSLDDLAVVDGCSTFQVIRLAKSGWGRTPFEHLTRLRMERAQELLEVGGMSTLAIAKTCGYSNPSHFATAFRRVMGASPAVFRR